jgi:hypothetical protein
MSEFHFIAVLTYGKERHSNQSCLKIARGAGADVLLTLFGSRARELTSAQASYRYVHLDVKDARTHQNYLVLRVTSEEKAQVETICRTVGSYTWVYLWEAEGRRWLEFPSAPTAHYIDPSSYGGTYPKFQPAHAAFVTPSKLSDADIPAEEVLTLTQSGNWWWIGGDTYRHKDTLKTSGARWSKSRRQWYIIGEILPEQIRALVARTEQSVTPAPPIPLTTAPSPEPDDAEERVEVDQPANESLMRSVRTDDVTAALVAHIHDSERGKAILIDFIGSRNAVKQLLAKPFNPAHIGARAEGHAFTVIDGSRYTGFRLPDTNYKALSATLGGRVVEGRIVALDATTSAPRTECYVLVMDRIELPRVGLTEPIEEIWLRYVGYRQTPNRPEFAHYAPPVWASDLYNVYQALRIRIGRPLHVRWMPWLFVQVADKPVASEILGLNGITLCKYIPGYLDPKALGVVERGAYRLTCRDLSNLWAEVLIRNPNRADGVTFGSTE